MNSNYQNSFYIEGHRGSRGTRSENTLVSIQEALDGGADGVEVDLLVTKDRQVVLHHDFLLNPDHCLTSRGDKVDSLPIFSLSLSEIKKIDCGTLPNPHFPKQKTAPGASIPTLQELFHLVQAHPRGKKIWLNLEIKKEKAPPNTTPEADEFAQIVAQEVEKGGCMKQAYLSSFDKEILVEVKKALPSVKIGLIEEKNLEELLQWGEELQADRISPHYSLLKDLTDLEKYRKKEQKIIPWTVNEIYWLDFLWKKGVDGITTDYPKEMIAHLKKKGR